MTNGPGAERTQLWLRSPAAANGPAPLSTSQQQTAATATWIDRREQYIERTPGNAPPEEKPAIADPTTTTNPNRLVALSPVLTKGVRISGRSSVTLRLSADQADAALGAVLVDYGDAPFDAVDSATPTGRSRCRTSRRTASGRTRCSTTGATSRSAAGTGPPTGRS